MFIVVLSFVISAMIIVVDQITKALTVNANFSVIGDFLWFTSSTNDGAAFGILSGAGWFFIALGLIAIVAVSFLIISNYISRSKFFKISLGIALGGIIGNLIDRIMFGEVRDFIYLKFINFAIFNIADMALTVSCVMLICFILFVYIPTEIKKDKKKNTAETTIKKQKGKTND